MCVGKRRATARLLLPPPPSVPLPLPRRCFCCCLPVRSRVVLKWLCVRRGAATARAFVRAAASAFGCAPLRAKRAGICARTLAYGENAAAPPTTLVAVHYRQDSPPITSPISLSSSGALKLVRCLLIRVSLPIRRRHQLRTARVHCRRRRWRRLLTKTRRCCDWRQYPSNNNCRRGGGQLLLH